MSRHRCQNPFTALLSTGVRERVRLDWDPTDEQAAPTDMHRPHATIDAVADGLQWELTRKHGYQNRVHVNLLELRAVKDERKAQARAQTWQRGSGLRSINLCDSRVVIGAWAKGRSSSRQINRVLRSCLGYAVAGRTKVCNVWVGTKSNPADDPTRHVAVRKCLGPTPVIKRHIVRTRGKDTVGRKLAQETGRVAEKKGGGPERGGVELLPGCREHWRHRRLGPLGPRLQQVLHRRLGPLGPELPRQSLAHVLPAHPRRVAPKRPQTALVLRLPPHPRGAPEEAPRA